jgi:ABC-2 type transport system ATP-binding protein
MGMTARIQIWVGTPPCGRISGQAGTADPVVIGGVGLRAQMKSAVELGAAERTLIGDYSTGMRKKIGLATALLHNPRLLVLDEPFEAVDPVSAVALKAILTRFVAGGGSVLLSSHVMALVEQLCDAVAVMADGRLVAVGSLDEVRGDDTLEAAFVRWVGADLGDPEGLSWLAS